jgi:outer membrane lipoprotein-sorting protein
MNILIALAFMLQKDTPEDVYGRIEKTVAHSKSLSIEYTVELTVADQKQAAKGTVQLREGNRHKITLSRGMGDGTKLESWSVSDGARVRCHPILPGSEQDWGTPDSLNESLAIGLLRSGCFELHRLPGRIHDHGMNPKEKLAISGFKFGDEAPGEKSLVFTLVEGSGNAQVRLWYDPKTFVLRKRVISLFGQTGQTAGTITETYPRFLINPELPRDLFKLPE